MRRLNSDQLRGALWAIERFKRFAFKQHHRGDWALLMYCADEVRAELKRAAKAGEQLPLVEGQ